VRVALPQNQPPKARAASPLVEATRNQFQRSPRRWQTISRRFVAGDSEHDFPLK
jgi:hypothetical protein